MNENQQQEDRKLDKDGDILSWNVSTTLGKFLLVLSAFAGAAFLLGYAVGYVFGKLN